MAELTKLGKYEIRRELGRGAMGIVYEAFDPLIERTVAIKTILKSAIDKSELKMAFSRFRREARAAGRLSHPKIVSIYEYGEDDDMAFIVMELIRGCELKEYFDHEDRFTIKDGIRIVLQVLDALDYSHAHRVVHRDIKPANIMITTDGQIKIADFGIAKIDSSHLTQVGIVLGTPTYMSPEQFTGMEVDHRADIYSCGVLLYQFLTGERPFTGSVITIMHKAVNQEAIPPSRLNPDVSQELDAVVSKAMSKRPENRYQTAAEFMQALKAAALATPAPIINTSEEPRRSLIDADEMFGTIEENIVLPGGATFKPLARRIEQESWQPISDSRDPSDFKQYLEEYPFGEFAEEAKLRIAKLENAANQKTGAVKQARDRANVAAQLEKLPSQETSTKEQLARKIAELKGEAAKSKELETAQKKKATEERAKHTNVLAAIMSERSEKFSAIVSARETERETERRLEAEARRTLEEDVRRKKEAKGDLRLKRKASRLPDQSAADSATAQPDSPAPNASQLTADAAGTGQRVQRKNEHGDDGTEEIRLTGTGLLVTGIAVLLGVAAIAYILLS